jgi:diguanylate cyclase (GGDEF)-like protein
MANLRIKTIAACILGAVLLFGSIAKWALVADHDHENRRVSRLLAEYAQKFSFDIPSYYTRPEAIEQLRAAITNLGTPRIYSILVDKTGRTLASGPSSRPEGQVARIVQAIEPRDLAVGSGSLELDGREHIWTSTAVAGTSYILLLVYELETAPGLIMTWIADPSAWAILLGLVALSGWMGQRLGALLEWAKALDNTIKAQALYDTVTGLPNRALFIDRLRQQIHLGRRRGHVLAVCHLNLDRFSSINEFLGASGGDRLLWAVGQRVLKTIRESDTVARLDSDQFLVLLNAIDENQILYVAQKILRSLQESFQIGDHNLFVRGNIGIALYPQHGEDEQTLRQHAESALKVAKKANTDVIVYHKKHDDYSVRHLALVNDLHTAITQNHLELFVQPKVNVETSTIVSAEVLLRWNHPLQGTLSPDHFIPIAEQTGLIQPLTTWVLESALKNCASMHRIGYPLTVAVNISMYNLMDTDFESRVTELLQRYQVEPRFLELEITESAMMSSPSRTKELLAMLDSLGVRFSIDDFGTGYSSLNYLKQLPVDELKIDKSFVLQMRTDDSETAIARTIIGLGRDLGIRVVAEGVESQELEDVLRGLGCPIMQGNHLCRALPWQDFIEWLQSDSQRYDVRSVSPATVDSTAASAI